MKTATNLFLFLAMTLLAACSSEPKNGSPEQKEERAMDEAAECDPLVGEFRDLMADYESALKEMIAAKKIDPNGQKEFSDKASDLSKRIKERGEKALGMKCWSEFNTIGQTYGTRIAKLGMEVMIMNGGMEGLEGMDPAALEAMKKVMGQ